MAHPDANEIFDAVGQIRVLLALCQLLRHEFETCNLTVLMVDVIDVEPLVPLAIRCPKQRRREVQLGERLGHLAYRKLAQPYLDGNPPGLWSSAHGL